MDLNIKIIKSRINNQELHEFLNRPFVDMIKFVVDIDKEIIALGGEMHSDAEELLLDEGSEQKNLWGANIYPDRACEKLEFESLINIRPSQNNNSLVIKSDEIKDKVKLIVNKLIEL